MSESLQQGSLYNTQRPSPAVRTILVEATTTNLAPSTLTSGKEIDSNASEICIEVTVDSVDMTSAKDVKLWLLSRGLNKWFVPDEGSVIDIQLIPGACLFFIIMDGWIYERVYVQVTKNDGTGKISSSIIYR